MLLVRESWPTWPAMEMSFVVGERGVDEIMEYVGEMGGRPSGLNVSTLLDDMLERGGWGVSV